MSIAQADIPEAFAGLLQPHRYKCFYGGRGSAKSWTFATCLICRAAERPLRILCTRETMTSIRESVHQLLSDRIYTLGLADQFIIGTTSIRHDNNGSGIHPVSTAAITLGNAGISACKYWRTGQDKNANWVLTIRRVA